MMVKGWKTFLGILVLIGFRDFIYANLKYLAIPIYLLALALIIRAINKRRHAQHYVVERGGR